MTRAEKTLDAILRRRFKDQCDGTTIAVQLDPSGRHSSVEIGGKRLARVASIAVSQRAGSAPCCSFEVNDPGAVLVTAAKASVSGTVRVSVLGQSLDVPVRVCACGSVFVVDGSKACVQCRVAATA